MGDMLRELRLGWQRFWGLRGWVKWPIVAVVSLVILAGIGAAIGDGDGDDKDTEDETLILSSTATRSPRQPTASASQQADQVERTATRVATASPKPATASPPTTPTPAPTSVPTPAGPATQFGSGTFLVNSEVAPGTYRTDGSSGCYWERLSGFGGSLGEIIANEFADYSQVVTISGSDLGFHSDGCGTWTQDLSPSTSSQDAPFGDGTYIVGVDIAAGTWRSDGTGDCYWARLAGFSHELGDIIANNFGSGQQVVTLSSGDVGFVSSDCGTWTKIG